MFGYAFFFTDHHIFNTVNMTGSGRGLNTVDYINLHNIDLQQICRAWC